MKKKTGIAFSAVVILLALFISSFIGIVVADRQRTYHEEFSISKEQYDVSTIEIYNRANNIDIDFIFLPQNSTNILDAFMNCSVIESYLHIPLEISISHRKSGEALKIFIRGSYHEDDYFSKTLSWNYTIKISSDYESYIFDSDTRDANIYLSAKGDFAFEEFKVSTRTGSFAGYLNHTSIKSDISLNSKSGDLLLVADQLEIEGNLYAESESATITLNFWDVIFSKPSKLNMTSDTGSVILFWAQHAKYNNCVDVCLNSNFLSKVKFWCRNEFMRMDLKMITEGTLDFGSKYSGIFNKISENHYQNTNYADQTLDFFKLLVSGKFESDVYIVNCFKPVRYHMVGELLPDGWSKSMSSFRSIAGNYTLMNSDFEITEIQFTNKAVENFDIPSNLNVTIGSLNTTSDSILEASWKLSYKIGSNSGFGSLLPAFNYTVEKSILYLDLFLNFDITRIYPQFTDGNLIINIHPALGVQS
ncbi:hypothetical protein NEF87_003907 [Candidatus Lokiarchaeum ossiferum]|uniref:Adhesin domain-containing protein n=1 Tax=Candidatus Lokiarchaeum ossiferum TaxID=2951803 RepID=A0ABY6HXN5_9ARCH|nr:hypothetical protein NEF87_003907 [Candidatus Lokiarchaeum sp. B-35]